MLGRTHFNPAWKLEPKLQEWLDGDKESQFNFYRKKCQCICKLGNIEKGALNKHMKAKKHSVLDSVWPGPVDQMKCAGVDKMKCAVAGEPGGGQKMPGYPGKLGPGPGQTLILKNTILLNISDS